jgi:hypothetical protein
MKHLYFFSFLLFQLSLASQAQIFDLALHEACCSGCRDCALAHSARTYPQEDGSIFREVTLEAGISYDGVTYGHGWADINGDGYPDLFANGHGRPQLYMNNGDGTFRYIEVDYFKTYDTINGVRTPTAFYDMHGVTWGDVNHDGKPDLYVPIGGDGGNSSGKENILFMNAGDSLVLRNSSRDYGLQDSLGRGRVGMWVDQNQDGFLDMYLTNFDRNDGQFKSALYLYNPETMKYDYVSSTETGTPSTSFYFSTLIRDPRNDRNNMIAANQLSAIFEHYDISQLPFRRTYLNNLFGIRDVAVGDFDGDGIQDAFAVSNKFVSEAAMKNDTTLQVFLYTKAFASGYATEHRASFRTEGKIKVEATIYPYKNDIRTLWRIGRNGRQPGTKVFELDPEDTRNHGFFNCFFCLGPHIGFNTNTGKWEVWVNDPIDRGRSSFRITSAHPILDVETHNFSNDELVVGDRLYLQNRTGGFRVINNFLTNASIQTAAVSVVAADFDNDMDLDLILGTQGAAINYKNLYYQNDGKGNFTLIEDFGAGGSIEGRTGMVSVADINNDGFPDVFVENGEGVIADDATALCFNDGPYQLFMNKGNANHWVMFDIKDDESQGNKLAYGTAAYVYAGGKKQVRLKGAENHAFGQNDPRLHFGLAGHTVVDSVQIFWPDGHLDIYRCLKADSIYKISGKSQSVAQILTVPAFDISSVTCFGSPEIPLPNLSLNGITGVWNLPEINTLESATYIFTPAPGQCADTFAFYMEVIDKAEPPLIFSNEPVLIGDTLFLQTVSLENVSYQWSGPNNFTSTEQNPIIFPTTFQSEGTYELIITANGCQSEPGRLDITVTDIAEISGKIIPANSNRVPSVRVKARGQSEVAVDADDGGQYFLRLKQGAAYQVRPEHGPTVTGASVADLIRLQQHLSGERPFTRPLDLIAADMNGSMSVTPADMSVLTDYLLGNIAVLPDGRDWVFIPSDFIFDDPENPFPFPDFRAYDAVETSVDQDFVAVARGHLLPAKEAERQSPLIWMLADYSVLEGKSVSVPVPVKGFNDISGAKWVVQWDPQVAKLKQVIAGDLAEPVFVGLDRVEEGLLTLLWSGYPVMNNSLPDESNWTILEFTAIAQAGAVTVLNSHFEEAFNAEIEKIQTQTTVGSIFITTATSDQDFTTQGLEARLVPNPATHFSNLKFYASKQENCRIVVTDIAGKKMKRLEWVPVLGWNAVEIGQGFAPGTYLITIEAGHQFQTLKLVVLK